MAQYWPQQKQDLGFHVSAEVLVTGMCGGFITLKIIAIALFLRVFSCLLCLVCSRMRESVGLKVVKALKRNDDGVTHAAIDMLNALMQVGVSLLLTVQCF